MLLAGFRVRGIRGGPNTSIIFGEKTCRRRVRRRPRSSRRPGVVDEVIQIEADLSSSSRDDLADLSAKRGSP